jgi:hypothetical protein
MERFQGPFHQSTIRKYLKCPRNLYYDEVLSLDRERVSMASLAGRAGHAAVNWAHQTETWEPALIFQTFHRRLEDEIDRSRDSGLEVHGQVDPDRYRVILNEYAARPWNREAMIMASEIPFYFEIKPSRTPYAFEGRLDQLISVSRSVLIGDFPCLERLVPDEDKIVIHRDLKFGRRKETSPFELALNTQIDVYAYALAYGIFAAATNDRPTFGSKPADYLEGRLLEIIPHLHAVYYMEDHIPYGSDGGAYLRDDQGGLIPCDLVQRPCLVGKKRQPCRGKRAWCTRQRRGPGMYFTARPRARLDRIPVELGRVCASIRMGYYPRHLGELCRRHCQFREVCQAEVMVDTEAA